MRYLTSDGDLPLLYPLTPLKQHHGELFDPQWGFTTPKFSDTLNPLSQWAIGPLLGGLALSEAWTPLNHYHNGLFDPL